MVICIGIFEGSIIDITVNTKQKVHSSNNDFLPCIRENNEYLRRELKSAA